MEKLKPQTRNGIEANIAELARLFPSCVTEERDAEGNVRQVIDFEQLKQELSDHVVEGERERYHLNWPGKRKSLLAGNAPIDKTLRPVRGESVNFDTTRNLFIEGDNLDALKLLQETYLGKVKMIYIDPPYNRGEDLIYKDDFTERADEYLERTDQIDEDGDRLVANTESNGRFHSDWLSMMYPRLKIAKSLLHNDGVIFSSIGVEEISNLKKLFDEVFGEENFIEIFSWVKTSTPPSLSAKSRKTNEYVLCYEFNKNNIRYRDAISEGGDQPLLNAGNEVRTLKFPASKVRFKFLSSGTLSKGSYHRVRLLDDIEIVDYLSNKDFHLEGEFKWTQENLNEEIAKGTEFVIKSDKLSIRFIKSEVDYKLPANFIKEQTLTPLINKTESGVGTNEDSSSQLSELMSGKVFNHPKPVSLIRYLANFITKEEDIILDFFAGSSTAAHAVMELNAEDGGNRQFIMVQLPEPIDPSDRKQKEAYDFCQKNDFPPNIAEISKERIRRAGTKILKGKCHKDWNKDVGFRVLKIDSSNMEEVKLLPDDTTQEKLAAMVDNIKPDRNAEDLLFGVLVSLGIDLTLPITEEKIEGKQVFFVENTHLAACFEASISEELAKALAERKPKCVVFRDSSFADNDALKVNVSEIFRQKSPSTEVKII